MKLRTIIYNGLILITLLEMVFLFFTSKLYEVLGDLQILFEK